MRRTLAASGMLLVLLATACSPAAPTADPAQIQASAVAAASTMVAMTQEAIPTATEVPPTEVPSPTPLPPPTVAELPTLAFEAPTAAPTQSSADDCLHPLDVGAAGPGHPTLIKNQLGGSINLSLNLNPKNAFGECGAISFANMAKNSSEMAQLPSGYWFAYAWGTTKGKDVKSSGSFYVQPAQFDKIELCVRESIIVYKPQC